MDIRQAIDLIEARSAKTLELQRLKYDRSALAPVLSASAIKYHYDELARGYVDRFNNREGDAQFNEAGAFLHNLFFEQFTRPKQNNRPAGPAATLINKKYGDFGKFKEQVQKAAMGIQGSGWVYMARNGEIKTIRNHAIRSDIALLIDWWEHAWFTDYGTNKIKYLNNIWRIINWGVVNSRL
jgi:Fe-Mn family superoxide dismutase